MSDLAVCDVCAGSGVPLSGKPCICGGSGYSHDEKAGLRRRVLDVQAELDAMTQRAEKAESEAADLKRAKRSYQIMVIETSKIICEDRHRGMLAAGQYSRGSGEVECKVCRLKVIDHPEVLPTLHLICSYEIIKT